MFRFVYLNRKLYKDWIIIFCMVKFLKIPKNKAKRDAQFKKLIAKDRKEEERRHKASLKSLKLRAKLNRLI